MTTPVRTSEARATREWALRSWVALCVFWLLAMLPDLSAAALEDAWNSASCKSCHGQPISPTNSPYKNIFLHLTERFSTAWCDSGHAGHGTTMCSASYIGNITSPATGTDLSAVYDFVVGARDTVVSSSAGVDVVAAFAATAFGSTRTQTLTITNYRSETLEFRPSITVNGTDFAVSNNTCTPIAASPLTLRVSAATAPGPAFDLVPATCSITVTFQPGVSTAPLRSGKLGVEFTQYSTAQPSSRDIDLSGTAQFPIYAISGVNTGTSPPSLSFNAATDGSDTKCPIVSNPTTTGVSLSIALSAGQASGTSSNYSSYYEMGALSDCSGAGLPALCVPVAPSVTGSSSLAAGGSCTLAIKFNPGKFGFAGGTGSRSASLTVTHNYPTAGQTANYTLVGAATSGPEPEIGISTNPSASGGQVLPPAFSHQVVGTTSAPWNEFLVSNSGTADGLDITAVTQTNPTEFAMTENCVAAPPLARLVGSSPTCTIALTFTPLAAPTGLGQRCTTVTIQAAFSSNGNQSVIVCGTGVPVPVPQMNVTPTSIAFGSRSIGAIYAPASVVIGNGAGATLDLQIGAVAISGTGFAFVPDASSCQNKSLAAGTSCTLQVQFTPDPSTPGTSYSANVTVDSNDPTTPHLVVPLTATAVASAVPVLQWQATPGALAFPDLVIAGQQSAAPLIAHLRSAGPGAVDVQAVRIVGADAANFSVTSCPALLYEGETCDVSVRFLPGSGGTKTAQIEVVTATGVAPALLTVQGQGVGGSSPFVMISTDALTFGGVRVGARSEPLEITLAAGGDGVLQVTSISADAPFSVSLITCPTPPFTLPLGADCRIGVNYVPSGTAENTGKLHILTNNGASAAEVTLDGVGQAQADVSSGGCTLVDGDPRTDPTLWLLVLLAAGVLCKRRNEPKR